jgi:hypothetical protein
MRGDHQLVSVPRNLDHRAGPELLDAGQGIERDRGSASSAGSAASQSGHSIARATRRCSTWRTAASWDAGMQAVPGQPPTATDVTPASTRAACAAARRASGTRYGEHET